MSDRCTTATLIRYHPKDLARIVEAPMPEAVLTREEVAAWLKLRPRQVERLGVPCLDLGRKTKRYLASDVRAWLEVHRQVANGPATRHSMRTPDKESL